VILAQARGSAADQAFWRRCDRRSAHSRRGPREATALLHQTGAIDDTLARARLYGAALLDALPISPAASPAEALAEAVESPSPGPIDRIPAGVRPAEA